LVRPSFTPPDPISAYFFGKDVGIEYLQNEGLEAEQKCRNLSHELASSSGRSRELRRKIDIMNEYRNEVNFAINVWKCRNRDCFKKAHDDYLYALRVFENDAATERQLDRVHITWKCLNSSISEMTILDIIIDLLGSKAPIGDELNEEIQTATVERIRHTLAISNLPHDIIIIILNYAPVTNSIIH
jgi:hypothetical protein